MRRRSFLKQAAAAVALAGPRSASVEEVASGPAPGIAREHRGPYREAQIRSRRCADFNHRDWRLPPRHIPRAGTGRHPIIRKAFDEGINFLDNCWDYNGGVCEERMRKSLQDTYRQRVFLMTKIDGRTGAEAC
jgi:hypothetical protein